MTHVATASTPHVIQRRNPATGAWVGVSYAVNLRETDAKLALLIRTQAGNGIRFRAIPAK